MREGGNRPRIFAQVRQTALRQGERLSRRPLFLGALGHPGGYGESLKAFGDRIKLSCGPAAAMARSAAASAEARSLSRAVVAGAFLASMTSVFTLSSQPWIGMNPNAPPLHPRSGRSLKELWFQHRQALLLRELLLEGFLRHRGETLEIFGLIRH
jgi:hypothetical protein